MFDVTLLSTKDKEQWLEILSRLDLKDPHYLPEYLEIYEKLDNRESCMHFGGEGILFVYGDSTNFIIYPFFKRSLSALPFYERGMENLFDISSPYGYGGPLAQIEDETLGEELWRGFFDVFGTFCRQNNIVSEFTRLHPMFNNAGIVSEFSDGRTERKGRIVYIDLAGSEEDIVARMSRTHKSGLRKAQGNPQLQSFATSGPEYAPAFYALYKETMIRKGAGVEYHFSSGFFEQALQVPGNHVTLCYVTYDTEIVSAVLGLGYGDLCYDWLSCSKTEHLHLYPNNMCTYQSAMEARKAGCKSFILGGGFSGEDSLFSFKAAFSGLFRDFHTYSKIHLEEEYNEIVRLRDRYEKEPAGDFFPKYRSYRAESMETMRMRGTNED